MLEILESVIRKPANEDSGTTLERFKGVMQLETISCCYEGCFIMRTRTNSSESFCKRSEKFQGGIRGTYFRQEMQGKCMQRTQNFSINVEKCTGCTVCAGKCPVNAIYGTRLQPFFIVEDKCIGCGICFDVCKFSAVIVK